LPCFDAASLLQAWGGGFAKLPSFEFTWVYYFFELVYSESMQIFSPGLFLAFLASGGIMIGVRRGADRGHTRLDWLASEHTFSFGEYYDPAFHGFRTLRVINEDRIRAEAGFATHAHRDMEILSYVIAGALEHKDTMGNHSVIREGELQVMSAGSGVQHSEFNPSESESVHFLQIWILPEKKGLSPSYGQKSFPLRERKNTLRLVGSRDGAEGALVIHQDVELYLGHLEGGKSLEYVLRSGRGAWVQVIRGDLSLHGVKLRAGDGAAVEKEKVIALKAESETEFFLFDVK
jgi:redox-sensitive bicupin YhaK (pirin superfamily)